MIANFKLPTISLARLAFVVTMTYASGCLEAQAQDFNYGKIAHSACEGSEADLKALQKQANFKGDALAMMWLRWTYIAKQCAGTFKGVDGEAANLLLGAARSGDANAARILGKALIAGNNGFQKNISDGFEWLNEASARGESKAELDLASEYISGKNTEQDLSKAQALVDRYKRTHGDGLMAEDLEKELGLARVKNGEAPQIAASKPQGEEPKSNIGSGAGVVAADGEDKELIYTKMPVKEVCWMFDGFNSDTKMLLMKKVKENELYSANSDGVIKYGTPLVVANFYLFNLDGSSPYKTNDWTTGTGVAKKITVYTTHPKAGCSNSPSVSASKQEMLERVYNTARQRKAKKLNWRWVPVPDALIEPLAQAGLVVN